MKPTKNDNWAAFYAASRDNTGAEKPGNGAEKPKPPAYPTCWQCTAIWWGFTISTVAIIGLLFLT